MIYAVILYDSKIISYYKNLLKEICLSKNGIVISWALKKNENLRNFLDYYFSCICPVKNKQFKNSTKIFWVLNDIKEFPKCKNPICNNNVIADCSIYGKYKKERCSIKCISIDPNVIKQKEETCLLKFGSKYMFQSDKFKKESAETCLKKYGRKFYVQTQEFKKKSKESCLKHYGVEYASQSNEFQNSVTNTSLKKYGISHWTKSEIIKEKIKKTCLEKYGVDNPFKNEKIKEKIHNTIKEKYGGPCPFSSNVIKEKARKTCLEKYGVKHPNQNPIIRKRGQHKYSYENVKFDSAPELALYIFLKDHQIPFEYQPNISFEYSYNGKKHVYIPDFKIEEQLYELKGDQFFNASNQMINPWNDSLNELMEAKHQCMLSNNIFIIRCADYKQYLDYVEMHYGKNFLKQFKN